MTGGHVCAIATVLTTGKSDPAAAGVYNSAAPRPKVPALDPAGLAAPGAFTGPGAAASSAPRREIPASLAGFRHGP